MASAVIPTTLPKETDTMPLTPAEPRAAPPLTGSATKPKSKPQAPRRFRLTERDWEILRMLNRYRYARTSQVRRLLFPATASPQMARRRLSNLADSAYRYAERIKPYVQIGNGSAECAWHLDRGGEELLRALGDELVAYPRHKRAGRVKHAFLAHALDLSEFRLVLELALQNHPMIELHRFTGEHELKRNVTAAIGADAYRLYDRVIDPHAIQGQSFKVAPDALVVLKGKGRFADARQLYFVEIDRGTEGLGRLRDKVIGYGLYHELAVYRKYGHFTGFLVLFQVPSPRRADDLLRALAGTRGAELVWVTDSAHVTETTVLSTPIWLDQRGERKTLLKTTSHSQPSGD
ncbi:MAG: replication-relaxation family protein [Gammaproteobacteria bacterium]